MRRCYEVHEEFMRYGENTVSNADLLAIIIGNKEKADKAVGDGKDIIDYIRNKSYSDFLFNGLSKQEAQRITAAIELGKRIAYHKSDKFHIGCPNEAAKYMDFIKNETHEVFYVILLNTKNLVFKTKKISEGSLTSAVVHPREVLAEAVVNHAASIIIAHNHPSGDPYPSTQDRKLTKALDDACEVMGVPLVDHVVIGDGCYYSFKEHGDI